jgi:hypothetical protein
MNEDVAAEAGLTTTVLATGAVRDHRGEPPGGLTTRSTSGSTTSIGPASRKPRPFRPSTTRSRGEIIDLSFWRAPERLFDEPDELVEWARIALKPARRVAAKTSQKSRRQPV